MATLVWVNIGSGDGFLHGGTKPLPEPKQKCVLGQATKILIS